MKFYADIDRKIEAVKASRARAVAEGHHASIRVYDGWLSNLYEQRANIRQHEASQPPPDTSTPDNKVVWYDADTGKEMEW